MLTLIELFGVLPDLLNRVKLLSFLVLRIKDIVQNTYEAASILKILNSEVPLQLSSFYFISLRLLRDGFCGRYSR